MPRRKGTPKTGGRVRGTLNKRSSGLLDAGRETAVRVLGEEATNINAYGLLQIVIRDPMQPIDRRMQAAVAVLPYEMPRLVATASITKHVDGSDDEAFGRLLQQIEAKLMLAPAGARGEIIDMLKAETEETE